MRNSLSRAVSSRPLLSRLALGGGAAVAALALAVPAAAPANAQVVKAASHGDTRVAIAKPVYKLLTSSGISVAPRGKATAGAFHGTVAAKFPITAIRHQDRVFWHKGGLHFSTSDVYINTGRFRVSTISGEVSGRVSGSEIGHAGRVVLFTLAPTDRPRLGDAKLELTKGAAKAFDATFGVNAFHGGDTFGYATVSPR
jgi:hypothetical protein